MAACSADLGAPPCECDDCRAEEARYRREYESAPLSERDPARYRREMIEAGRGRLLREEGE